MGVVCKYVGIPCGLSVAETGFSFSLTGAYEMPRVVTGGEAARFLAAVIADLVLPD